MQTKTPTKPSTQPAGTAQPGSAVAATRAEQLIAYRAHIILGLSPAQAAAELGLSLVYVHRLDSRERAFGQDALRPGFKPPLKPRAPRPVDFSAIGKCPPRGAARFLWLSLYRAFVLGRILQLRANGLSAQRACKLAGCSHSSVSRMQDCLAAGGLLALEIKAPTGRHRNPVPHCALRPKIVRRVQLLAVAYGAGRAWREFAKRPDCPPRLRSWLNDCKYIPDALLDAVRVRVNFIEGGAGFTVMPQSKAA